MYMNRTRLFFTEIFLKHDIYNGNQKSDIKLVHFFRICIYFISLRVTVFFNGNINNIGKL